MTVLWYTCQYVQTKLALKGQFNKVKGSEACAVQG